MKYEGKTFRQTEELDVPALFEEQGIDDFQLLQKDLKVFDMVLNPNYEGGKMFDIWEFYSPTNMQTKILAITVTGYLDDVVTEIFSFSFEEDEEIDIEEVRTELNKIV